MEGAYGRQVVALIPAYQPGPQLPQLVDDLSRWFSRVVVVNDGSTRGLSYFELIRPSVEAILVHPVNRGKGAAIKTALAYLGESLDIITVDADGQHAVEDVVQVAKALKEHRSALILGVRDLRLGRIPLRSWWGNAWMVLILRVMTGRWFTDTQTGLRGIPALLVSSIQALPGDRYDFELVMLAVARRFQWSIHEVSISTIYQQGNATSHFSPIKDSFRNFKTLFHSLGVRPTATPTPLSPCADL